MGAVRHPNLRPIAGFELVDGEMRATFEDDGGTTLDRLSGPALDQPRATVVGLGILAGLQALQRAGLGHGSLTAAAVAVSPLGQVRLTDYGQRGSDPRADVAAAGRILCQVMGVDPRRRADDPSLPPLAAAALAIASGGAGGSATTALMAFGDAAGRIVGRLRIERTMAGLTRLAVPGTPALAAAVDRVLSRPQQPAPAPLAPPRRLAPARVSMPKDPAPVPLPRPPLAALPSRSPDPAPPVPAPMAPAGPQPAPARPLPSRPRRDRGVLAGLAAAVLLALLLIAAPALFTARRSVPSAAAPATPAAARPAPAASAAPAAGAAVAATPDAVVANFYSLAQDKHFDQALALWDDHLKAAYPPDQNLYQRFADTTLLTVNSASVTQRTDTFAVVATDLTEVTDGVRYHWIGQWRLIRSGGSWLLDQPDFQAA